MGLEKATLAGGCFWCTEAIFKRLKGVESVMSGYAGGEGDHPSYEQVSTGTTGHAEAIQIKFDPKVISYETLLGIFFHLHDPTTLNRQGSDTGSQYRSAVFYHDESQRQTAEKFQQKLEDSGQYHDPIVTEVVAFTNFFPADESHRDYYEQHKSTGYCQVIIDPKITKLYQDFGDKVKKEYKGN